MKDSMEVSSLGIVGMYRKRGRMYAEAGGVIAVESAV